MVEDEDLEMLRKKRMQELQTEDKAEQQFEEQKHSVLRQILEPEARERLARLRLARPQVAQMVEQQVLMLAQSGRLNSKIDDKTLRQLLARVVPKKREISIERR